MTQQFVILTIYLILAFLIAVAFIVTALQARKGPDDYEKIHHTGYRIRRYWFIFLLVVVVGGLGATLPHMPYPMVTKPASGTKVTTVNVHGMQFGWLIDDVPLRAHRPILFRVTSDDVNHDFMIENSQGEIIAQVQAMPTVTNDLYVTFDHPGTYTIRCGELCGLYHTDMLGSIEVKA